MLFETYEAAATALVGVDLARNERRNVSSKPRVLRGIAVVGGNAINEAAIDVYIEDYYVGRFRNTASGVTNITIPDDVKPVGPHYIPAGSKVSLIVAVAPTVSPILVGCY